jgi:hypothetical protein
MPGGHGGYGSSVERGVGAGGNAGNVTSTGYGSAPVTTGPSTPSSGGQTRYTNRNTRRIVQETIKPVEDVVKGPVTKLFGAQTGSEGFTLENIKTVTGTAGAASMVAPFKCDDGVVRYLTLSDTYS